MMNDDNFEDFFNSDDDSEDLKREMEEERKRVQNLPILKKAYEIYETTNAIVSTINEEDDVLEMRHQMLENAMIIPAKISEAEGLYTFRMENAVIKFTSENYLHKRLFVSTKIFQVAII